MNENGKTLNSLHIQMDDLATGQLGPLAAWRLRRRIARDPLLTREFAEIQQMRTDMESIARQYQLARRPITSTVSPTLWTIGGLKMKRRAVLAATAALTFVTITGAVAARHYLSFTPHFTFSDNHGTTWDIRTNLPGTLRFFSAEGKLIGQMTTDGGFPRGSDIVLITYAGRQDHTVHGYGKHLLRSKSGALLGYLEVVPLSPREKLEQKTAAVAARSSLEALYKEPNNFTANGPDSGGSGGVTGSPGLTAGYLTDHGLSWKMVGYALVTAEYISGDKPERQQGAGSALPSADVVPLPVRDQFARLAALAPSLDAVPQVYWQIAGDDHTVAHGTWRDLRRSGQFAGYGKHEVKDENGKTVLVLTVSPLTPAKAAR